MNAEDINTITVTLRLDTGYTQISEDDEEEEDDQDEKHEKKKEIEGDSKDEERTGGDAFNMNASPDERRD